VSGVGDYTPDSVIWRVHREQVLMLGGGCSLLLQATHPLALAGFLEHSNYSEDPWGRLWRTSEAVGTAIYGTREDAERIGRLVRAMHHRVRGVTQKRIGPLPAGTPYEATDPDLLLWVHATLVESTLLTYRTYVRELTRDEQESYWQDMKPVGELFGIPPEAFPETYGDFEAYLRWMLDSDLICVTEEAREIARATVLGPPLPAFLRPAWPAVNFLTAALLPKPIREGYGFRWTLAHEAARTAFTAYVKRAVMPFLPEPARVWGDVRASERSLAA
jgi:uncharacterized protein (DUF2236 family)